jgi:hypothetical protein
VSKEAREWSRASKSNSTLLHCARPLSPASNTSSRRDALGSVSHRNSFATLSLTPNDPQCRQTASHARFTKGCGTGHIGIAINSSGEKANEESKPRKARQNRKGLSSVGCARCGHQSGHKRITIDFAIPLFHSVQFTQMKVDRYAPSTTRLKGGTRHSFFLLSKLPSICAR